MYDLCYVRLANLFLNEPNSTLLRLNPKLNGVYMNPFPLFHLSRATLFEKCDDIKSFCTTSSLVIFSPSLSLFPSTCIKSLLCIGAFFGLYYTCPNHLSWPSLNVFNWCCLYLSTNYFISYSIFSCITTHPSQYFHFGYGHLMHMIFSIFLVFMLVVNQTQLFSFIQP